MSLYQHINIPYYTQYHYRTIIAKSSAAVQYRTCATLYVPAKPSQKQLPDCLFTNAYIDWVYNLLFNFLFLRVMWSWMILYMHTDRQTEKQTDGPTDGRHDDANSLSYCVAARSAKNSWKCSRKYKLYKKNISKQIQWLLGMYKNAKTHFNCLFVWPYNRYFHFSARRYARS